MILLLALALGAADPPGFVVGEWVQPAGGKQVQHRVRKLEDGWVQLEKDRPSWVEPKDVGAWKVIDAAEVRVEIRAAGAAAGTNPLFGQTHRVRLPPGAAPVPVPVPELVRAVRVSRELAAGIPAARRYTEAYRQALDATRRLVRDKDRPDARKELDAAFREMAPLAVSTGAAGDTAEFDTATDYFLKARRARLETAAGGTLPPDFFAPFDLDQIKWGKNAVTSRGIPPAAADLAEIGRIKADEFAAYLTESDLPAPPTGWGADHLDLARAKLAAARSRVESALLAGKDPAVGQLEAPLRPFLTLTAAGHLKSDRRTAFLLAEVAVLLEKVVPAELEVAVSAHRRIVQRFPEDDPKPAAPARLSWADLSARDDLGRVSLVPLTRANEYPPLDRLTLSPPGGGK